MAGLPYRLLKQGEVRGDRSRQVQPANVLLLQLARWERGGIYSGDDREAILANERSQLAAATASLLSLAPTLSAIDRTRVQLVELSISTIREESTGGLVLPAPLVVVAARAGLSIGISILVSLDEDDDGSGNPVTRDDAGET